VGDLSDPLRDAEVSELAAGAIAIARGIRVVGGWDGSGVTDGSNPVKGTRSQIASDASDSARCPRDSDDPDRRTKFEARLPLEA
jgi:hypothetical protein